MKAIILVSLVSLALLLTPTTGMCAKRDSKLVTRVESVTAQMKGRKVMLQVAGMATSPALLRVRGHLLSRNGSHDLNKEGLLEYNFYYDAPANYSGDKLTAVRATLKESSVPPGVKGVRIFGEFNDVTRLLAEPKKKKKSENNL
jgi:hypothetical protein